VERQADLIFYFTCSTFVYDLWRLYGLYVCTYTLCSKTQPYSSCVWNTVPVTCQYGHRAGAEGARDIQENRETGEDFVV